MLENEEKLSLNYDSYSDMYIIVFLINEFLSNAM